MDAKTQNNSSKPIFRLILGAGLFMVTFFAAAVYLFGHAHFLVAVGVLIAMVIGVGAFLGSMLNNGTPATKPASSEDEEDHISQFPIVTSASNAWSPLGDDE